MSTGRSVSEDGDDFKMEAKTKQDENKNSQISND